MVKKPNIVRDKSFGFALRIVKLDKLLVEQKEFVLSKQCPMLHMQTVYNI